MVSTTREYQSPRGGTQVSNCSGLDKFDLVKAIRAEIPPADIGTAWMWFNGGVASHRCGEPT
jgi:hypothetical protein